MSLSAVYLLCEMYECVSLLLLRVYVRECVCALARHSAPPYMLCPNVYVFSLFCWHTLAACAPPHIKHGLFHLHVPVCAPPHVPHMPPLPLPPPEIECLRAGGGGARGDPRVLLCETGE